MIEESLQRLEKVSLIVRSGDVYFFLTNEERDINREIKNVEVNSGEESKFLGELVFNDVLKEQRKYRYPVNKMDFTFNRVCDLHPIDRIASLPAWERGLKSYAAFSIITAAYCAYSVR